MQFWAPAFEAGCCNPEPFRTPICVFIGYAISALKIRCFWTKNSTRRTGGGGSCAVGAGGPHGWRHQLGSGGPKLLCGLGPSHRGELDDASIVNKMLVRR